MPQIRIITADRRIREQIKRKKIDRSLIDVLEGIWPATKKDVTFTLIPADHVCNECDIQLELHYTPKYGGYQSGMAFEPKESDLKEAPNALGKELKKTFRNDILASVMAHGETMVLDCT